MTATPPTTSEPPPGATPPAHDRPTPGRGPFTPELSRLGLVLGLVTFVVVGSLWATRQIEHTLAARSQAALRSAGIPATVAYHGLDAVLTGTVAEPGQAADAIGTVVHVPGTRHVTSRLTYSTAVAPPPAPVGAPAHPTAGPAPATPTPAGTPGAPGVPELPPGSIMFASNDATLPAAARTYLDDVAAVLRSDPQLRLAVHGHSDNSGTDEINWALSRQRAIVVVDYLVSRQIPADRLRTEAFAATSPVASNHTPEGRAANRRVELAIEGTG